MPMTATPPATDIPTMDPVLRPDELSLEPPVADADAEDEVVVAVAVTVSVPCGAVLML